ncbi:hypothetical protein [Marinobacter caseinilyticus]|uniref:hypothetical protein n=1 Tax=Marinobacter caseinilyticus TaxID=2692195 RepID=UPI00140AF597|nr:hypothetical protein [Marinobacter caseinilyticus]
MNNVIHHLLRRQIQIRLVVLPLLALLLVFLFSITHQHASSAPAEHGFVGNLDHLVAASHKESIRPMSGTPKNDVAADGGPDYPGWWHNSAMLFWPRLYRNICNFTADSGYPPASPRFLIPLLRAPPLA